MTDLTKWVAVGVCVVAFGLSAHLARPVDDRFGIAVAACLAALILLRQALAEGGQT